MVNLYWDLQNVSIQKSAHLLLSFAQTQGHLLAQNVYYNSQCQNQAQAKKPLSRLGFDCRDVPCPLKDSADHQLIAHCLKDIHSDRSPDIIILVSGDGDFCPLVRNLQSLDKKVIIFAQLGNVKQKLKDLVQDDFYFVDQLPKLVQVKTNPQTTAVKAQLIYEEAIDCLRNAIQTALNQGQRTSLSQIGKLMRHNPHFPKCSKFPLVCKSDGTTFSKLSKFVNAAISEGIVYAKTTGKEPEFFLSERNRLLV
ncbi:NYN domain-containing protein [Coleofasciculus chthonoplastes]|uniref:NYN domain-containing protein n=1 Tax=Coleofasciculus chthonoplastes TaxID=64178 RepID=UPI0018DB0369|nr:NYN domain-containing protein [Coleofasciculus chthonoplastes]